MSEDPRKIGLKNGLRQLTSEQIRRVLSWPYPMVLDTYNYESGCYCPLAVGVGLPGKIENPTHEKVFCELSRMGYQIYNTRGIKGEFYTTDRLRDLKSAAEEVLAERGD
jgi:hypothetical protein